MHGQVERKPWLHLLLAWVHIETLGGSGPIFCYSDVGHFDFFYSCAAQPFLLYFRAHFATKLVLLTIDLNDFRIIIAQLLPDSVELFANIVAKLDNIRSNNKCSQKCFEHVQTCHEHFLT